MDRQTDRQTDGCRTNCELKNTRKVHTDHENQTLNVIVLKNKSIKFRIEVKYFFLMLYLLLQSMYTEIINMYTYNYRNMRYFDTTIYHLIFPSLILYCP